MSASHRAIAREWWLRAKVACRETRLGPGKRKENGFVSPSSGHASAMPLSCAKAAACSSAAHAVDAVDLQKKIKAKKKKKSGDYLHIAKIGLTHYHY